MTTIKVFHQNESGTETLVATVTTELTGPQALEFAYRYTNNVDGSWSRKDTPNGDLNDAVVVEAELPVFQGKVYGLRSTMMGDTLVKDGTKFRVAAFGFKLAN